MAGGNLNGISGTEPFGFAIDNLTIGSAADLDPALPVPAVEPGWLVAALAVLGVAAARRAQPA